MQARRGPVRLVVVGSIGLDTIETPEARREDVLGGSVSYACAAASFFTRVGMVGVVGTDFPDRFRRLYAQFGIDLAGLQTRPGKTFRWSGAYEPDMINRRTLSTELNVFEAFSPQLPEAYRNAPFLLLGNIAPALQAHVLGQSRRPRFVVADTMDLWIRTARPALLDVVRRVDLLMVNDAEARLLTGQHSLRACARRILDWGPAYVVVKKGEHGALLLSRDGAFLVPAYPVNRVRDPTGAGDSFAGAFLGRLARDGAVTGQRLRSALLEAASVASFGVEAFGLGALRSLRPERIRRRTAELKAMIRV